MHSSNLPFFPDREKIINEELDNLFHEWYELSKNIIFENDLTEGDICFDGFYPYYSYSKIKILFIGREALGISGENYIDCLFPAIKNNKIGKSHINKYKFHNRMIYISFAVNNNFPKWTDIPYASALTNLFGEKNGISYAFMNLSKLSNDSDNWKLNRKLFESFVYNYGDHNFFNNEIKILDPEVIITMNLNKYLKVLGDLKLLEEDDFINSYRLKVGGKEILLFDTYHFSSYKNDITEIYQPFKKQYLKYK